MIEIRIPEVYYPEDQNQVATPRSNLDIFIDGFKKLCEVSGMTKINLDKILDTTVVTQLKFNDGSLIGTKKLFQTIGFNIQ